MWLFFNLQQRKSKEEAELKRKAELAEAAMNAQLPKKSRKFILYPFFFHFKH